MIDGVCFSSPWSTRSSSTSLICVFIAYGVEFLSYLSWTPLKRLCPALNGRDSWGWGCEGPLATGTERISFLLWIAEGLESDSLVPCKWYLPYQLSDSDNRTRLKQLLVTQGAVRSWASQIDEALNYMCRASTVLYRFSIRNRFRMQNVECEFVLLDRLIEWVREPLSLSSPSSVFRIFLCVSFRMD